MDKSRGENGSVIWKTRLFEINTIGESINPLDASRKRMENIENEPVTE